MSDKDIETLRWAWEMTWRQHTAQDERMRERLRMMIPKPSRPEREVC